MQINNAVNPQIIKKQQNFKGSSANSGLFLKFTTPDPDNDKIDGINNTPAINKIIEDYTKANEALKEKPGFWRKLFAYPSLIIIPTLIPSFLDIYNSVKERHLKKQIKKQKITEEKLQEFKKSSSKNMKKAYLSAIPLFLITDYLNKKFKDKNFAKANKQIEDFNQQNNLNIKITDTPLTKHNYFIAAGFSPVSARMQLIESTSGDVIRANVRQKYFVNHELIHAKQFILMASSKGGINRLNHILVKRVARKLNENNKLDIYNAYQEILNLKDNRYNDINLSINNNQINLINYVTALYKVIYENETNPDDVPIIINKDFYEKAKAVKGSLTEEEEKKAQAYFDAYEKYPKKIGFIQGLNPFSSYHQNLLEKEAFKAIPWYSELIMVILAII